MSVIGVGLGAALSKYLEIHGLLGHGLFGLPLLILLVAGFVIWLIIKYRTNT